MHNRFRDILLMRKTGKVISDSNMFDKRLGSYLNDRDYGGVITTATGNPVSIVTNRAQNAISTLLSYSPKQSGTGDPSPQNIRPIEGWTEANLGVNSETPTTTISLGGTYYGFSVDVERGVLRAKYAKIEFTGDSSEAWTHYTSGSSNNVWQFSLISDSVPSIEGSSAYSNIAPYGVTTSTRSRYNYGCYTVSSGSRIAFQMRGSLDVFTDATTWKEYLAEMYVNGTPVYAIYELAEPIELPLTPQTVALLAGNNTIWTDGDEVSVTYKAKKEGSK